MIILVWHKVTAMELKDWDEIFSPCKSAQLNKAL